MVTMCTLLITCLPSSSTRAMEAWLSLGSGWERGGFGAWQVLTVAPNGRLDTAGARIRGHLSGPRDRFSATLEGGWQFSWDFAELRILGGVTVRNSQEISPVATFELDKTLGQLGLSAGAIFRPTLGESWLELRPWFDLGEGWKIGIGAALALSRGERSVRASMFSTGYRIPMPIVGQAFAGVEFGVSATVGDLSLEPYAGINLGFGF